MLNEQRKAQLDGIVKQMISNNEPDNNIQFVVDDFKKLHGSEKDKIEDKPGYAERIARTLLPKGVESFGETLGESIAVHTRGFKNAQESDSATDDLNLQLAQQIGRMKKEGKDTTNSEAMLKRNSGDRFNASEIAPSIDKTAKQIYGEGLETAGFLTIGANPLSSVSKRLAMGTALGGTFGTAKSMQLDEDLGNVVSSGLTGAMIGLAIGGVFEGVGALARKIVSRIGKHTFNKELQPPQKDLTKQVERGFQTFGEKVRNVKDAGGRGVYKGTYKTMLNQSKEQLKKQGGNLDDVLKNYDPRVKVTKSQAAGDIIEQLQDTFGKLKKSQLEQVKFEVNRMSNNMNATQMLKSKRMYDGIIPDSFWLKAGDSNVAFATQVKYILRDNLRKLINEKTDDVLVTKLNNELSIAMDVRHLASEQIAGRAKRKISGEGGWLYKLVGRFIDDYVFNPTFTTRASHGTQKVGQKTGQTPIRAATRGLITKELAE